MVLVFGLSRVRQGVDERGKGNYNINRVSDAANNLLRLERNGTFHKARVMRFHNHHTVVDDFLTSEAHALKRSSGVKFDSSTSVNASHLFNQATKHTVATAGEGVEGNSLLHGFAI